VLKTDFANAFNACRRSHIWKALLSKPEAAPLWRLFHFSYGQSTPLHTYDQGNLFATIESCEGVRQGDPLAAFAFALAVQPLYEEVIRDLECKGVAIQDDLTLIGPSHAVLEAFERLKRLAPDYHLDLQSTKCEILLPQCTTHHESIRNQWEKEGVKISQTHTEILGTWLSGDNNLDEIEKECDAAVDAQQLLFDRLQHPLMCENNQIGLSLLRHR
jgi:hypothetical protein